MKFLADMGVSLSTVEALRTAGHDAVHLRDEGLSRLSDARIIEKARQEARVVLTFDLDFADLLALNTLSLPSTIIFRLRNQTPAWVTPRLLQVLDEQAEALQAGALVMVEDMRYRLRHLPVG